MKKIDFNKLVIYVLTSQFMWILNNIVASSGYNYAIKLNRPSFFIQPIVVGVMGAMFNFILAIIAFKISNTKHIMRRKGLILYAVHLVLMLFWNITYFSLQLRLISIIIIIFILYLVLSFCRIFNQVSKLLGIIAIPYVVWIFYILYLNIGFWVLNM